MAAAEYLGIDVGGTGVKMGIVHADTGQINNFQSALQMQLLCNCTNIRM
jgi:sugar (pentulose or hexulose) kinase